MRWRSKTITGRGGLLLSRLPFPRELRLDMPLLLGVVLLVFLGLGVLYSSSGQDEALVVRQFVRFVVGLGLMFVLAHIRPERLHYLIPVIYIGCLLLLVGVLFFGDVAQGARRWLRVGPVGIQPSELAKLAVPMMVTYFVCAGSLPVSAGRVAVAGLLIAVPVAMIMAQPDLGTSMLVAVAGCFVLFFAGISRVLIALGGAVALAAMPLLWGMMHDYQRRRILTLLNPQEDPLGAGYHIIQSTIAIGSGGLYGKGWLNGTQSRLDFLPERSTDFIFAVISEEFGLLGVLLLLVIYFSVIGRGLFIAYHAQETFGRILAGALTLTFFCYVFVNIGMVSGILPVVGIPLPLISYGGTSMVTLMAGFGIMMSIHTHRRLLSA
ncbi:MAG: rod shape-determining protein RodA [Ectothiorhodospiraceae bacterium AqS1]|nr:rod shape-determining protein RodA [Ectothiorhodospiraceae bacterium AqS1]MBF2759664.1 rod shape-determining protein RodA [Ectothiorhodospiraceae bacterium AqS1]